MAKLLTQDNSLASSLCFGTMQFGDKANLTNSRAMYEKCRSVGINFFDTAHAYTEGKSETFLGEISKGEQDEVIIATKVAYDCAASNKNIRKSLDTSRKRLDMDTINILYMHRWDPNTDLQETFECMAELKNEKLIRYVGVSNYAAWQVMKAQAVASKFDLKIDLIQPMYNLVKRQVEVEILPMCLSEEISVCPYSPLGGGLLTGKYINGSTGRLTENDRYRKRYDLSWMHSTASKLSSLAKETNVSASTLAVAWVAKNKAIYAPIISGHSVEQIEPSINALSFNMNTELYAKITSLSIPPTPATDRLEEI